MPLSTYHRPERVGVREWLGGGAICGGLLAFLLARGAATGLEQADRGRLLPLVLLIAITVVALTVAAVTASGSVRAVLLALAAGMAFASSATLVKLTSDDLTRLGVVHTATDWPGYGLALAAGAGLVLQQAAFAAGKLPTATTAMVVMNPIVGTVVAVYAFHEGLPADPVRRAFLSAGALVVILGVALLTRSPLLGAETDEPDPGNERRSLQGADGRGSSGRAGSVHA